MSIALNQKHASREFLRFWVLKLPFTKENVEHSQNERVKKLYQQIYVDSIVCYCRDNGRTLRTSLKTLVSNNTAT